MEEIWSQYGLFAVEQNITNLWQCGEKVSTEVRNMKVKAIFSVYLYLLMGVVCATCNSSRI